jgi:hypothetical protein
MPADIQAQISALDPNAYVMPCGGRACRDSRCGGWVLARSGEDGKTKMLAHRKDGYCDGRIVQMFRERMSPNAPDLFAEAEAHNLKREAELEAASEEAMQESAERLYVEAKKF